MSTIDEIYKKIKKAKSIVLLTHENPDGDAIGSSIAMYLALKGIGKENVDLIIPEYAKCFSELPGIEYALKEGTRENYDLAITLDVATIKLLNGWSRYFENADYTVVIDHHSSNSMFGDLNYVEYSSPACAQVLYLMFRHYRWKLTQDIGDNLMCGIITDTGGFQYDKVSKETFEIASSLMGLGVHLNKIYNDTLIRRSRANFELQKIALSRLELLEDGKIAFSYITKKDLEDAHADTGDYEGLVNEGRSIEGVEVNIFMHEIEDGYRISLRSNQYVNVSEVALIFGGGGHSKAAGCTASNLTPEEIKEKLVQEIKHQL